MRFSVEQPSLAEASFFESDPWAVCHNGHSGCSCRPDGPCLEYPCTCETTGHCLSCAPSRLIPVDRVDTGRVL